jgi:hypothetical protein
MPVRFCIVAALFTQLLATSPAAQQSASSSTAVLDFEYFKTQVQPVFLTKRPGYTRCVTCHSEGGAVGFLRPLSPGATSWNEEESRRNFEAVSRLVTPGQPLKSRLLLHPLEPAAGGDEFHNGGRQFTSRTDPEFQTIAAWVLGKAGGAAGR